MTARIEGFVTRRGANLRPPSSFSRDIDPEDGGSAVHWGGPAQGLGSHARCVAIWRGWQRFHMDDRGWADIAYTGGFCNHGYAFAGRGFGVRTAANGTTASNRYWYAFSWIGGQGDRGPTAAAVDAFEWWVREARTDGGAGRGVAPHSRFTDTSCPGPPLRSVARRLDGAAVPVPGPPSQEEAFMLLVRRQGDSRVYHVLGDRLVHVPDRKTMRAILGALGERPSSAIKSLPANHPIFSLPVERR